MRSVGRRAGPARQRASDLQNHPCRKRIPERNDFGDLILIRARKRGAGTNGDDDSNERFLGVSQQCGVAQQIPLDAILVGNHSAASLVPVIDDRRELAVLEDVAVYLVRGTTSVDGTYAGRENLPPRSGQAVSR